MGGKILKVVIAVIVLFGVAQLIPIDRTNPPVLSDIAAPGPVDEILRRSCYDCHSNETVWPWYSRVAPISWLVAHDVQEGREQLNFSVWGEYSAQKRQKQRKEIWEVIEEGEMPPLVYLPAHPAARLSDQDKAVIRSWLGN